MSIKVKNIIILDGIIFLILTLTKIGPQNRKNFSLISMRSMETNGQKSQKEFQEKQTIL